MDSPSPPGPASPRGDGEEEKKELTEEELNAAVANITEKVNENLIKAWTYNAWCTEAQIRKDIAKKRAQLAKEGKDVEDTTKGQPPSRLHTVLPGLVRIGKNPSAELAFLSFATPESRDAARPVLEQMKGKKGKFWELMEVTDHDLSYFTRKSKAQVKRALEGDGGSAKKPRPSSIHDVCEPLHTMPYSEQLEKKLSNLKGTLKDMYQVIQDVYKKDSQTIPPIIKDQMCTLTEVIPSPVTEGYRNKVEMTCGKSKEGEKAVGFLFGSMGEAMGWIEPPYDLRIIPDTVKSICRKFEGYMKGSDLPVFDRVDHKGFWRLLLVREGSREGRKVSMVVVQVQPVDDKAVMEKVNKDLVDLYSEWLLHPESPREDADPSAPLIESVQVVHNTSLNNACPETAPVEVVHGPPCIFETALGLRFKVSPFSFFQVNTKGNEVLLNVIRDFAGLSKDTVLLDLCCGTGTIGLSLARSVKQVVGIDMVQSAIDDARLNAKANGIDNATYHCDRAENLVNTVLAPFKSESQNVIAIVDPPRGGLHTKVLHFLRGCTSLSRFVYVSCQQSSLVDNTAILTKACSQKITGLPFRPVKAVGVDLFPHCDRQEMIVLFERLTKDEYEAKSE